MTTARLLAVVLLAACAATATAADVSTWSAWTGSTGAPAGTIGAAPDWQAPVVGAAAVGKSAGGSSGFIRQGGGYYIYAAVTDGGNPASGTSTVIAGAATISIGATAVALVAGSFSADGVAYNRRSALLTANAVLPAGAYATTIATSDVAANSAVVNGPPVTVDNTAPAGVSINTANGGAIAGRPEAGDTVTFTWSKTLDPFSVLAGWSGGATAVRVIITDVGSKDTLTIGSTGGVLLPLGSTLLDNDYATSTATFDATMTQSGSSIVVTLGALVSGSPRTDTHNASMSWITAAVPGATDRAGNALLGSTVAEAGTSDSDF